jgi:prepilin-type N-terminal cleavage/methylation domain-containing protein
MNIHLPQQKGFTLIEMLVALGIFSSVVLLVTSIFLFGIRNQQRSAGTQEALNQVSFASEFMVRALRVAKKDDGEGCITAGRNYQVSLQENAVRFRNSLENEDCQEFFTQDNMLYFTRGIGTIEEETLALLSPKMSVQDIRFIVDGDGNEQTQPRVTLMLDIITDIPEPHRFHFQTTVSQRDIEL